MAGCNWWVLGHIAHYIFLGYLAVAGPKMVTDVRLGIFGVTGQAALVIGDPSTFGGEFVATIASIVTAHPVAGPSLGQAPPRFDMKNEGTCAACQANNAEFGDFLVQAMAKIVGKETEKLNETIEKMNKKLDSCAGVNVNDNVHHHA